MKFKFFLMLSTLVLNFASGVVSAKDLALNAQITLNDEIKTSLDQNSEKYIASSELNRKCRLWVKSSKAVTLKVGDNIKGTVVKISEKEVWKDSDMIGKQSTTQFTFVNTDKSLEITAACFGEGLFLPTFGLPNLEELLEIFQPKLTLTVNE